MAMAMTQRLTQEQVKSILNDVDGSTFIVDKTKKIRHFAGKVSRNAYKVAEKDMAALRAAGCSDVNIFEALAITSLVNTMDRMADALGAPVEGFQEMRAQMQKEWPAAKE